MKRTISIIISLLFLFSCINAQNTNVDALIQKRAKEKVALMLNYISHMADKKKDVSTRKYYKQKALNLYIGAGLSYLLHGITYDPVKMQVSSIRSNQIKNIPISEYFERLINYNYSAVKITYTEVADMKVSDLKKIDEGLYQCTVQYVQVFRGYRDGELRYADKTVKRVVCYVKERQTVDGEEYVILLGDTHCEQTDPLNN